MYEAGSLKDALVLTDTAEAGAVDDALSARVHLLRLSGERQAWTRKPRKARSDYFADAEPEDGDGCPTAWLLTGSRSIRGRLGGEKRMPSPSSTGSTYTRISSTRPRCRHWRGHVGAEDLQVLAARGAARRGDRFPDVTGEVRDAPDPVAPVADG